MSAKPSPARLKIVTGSAPAASRPRRIPSPRQQQVTAHLSLISRTWPTLTDAQRQGFADLAKLWSPSGKTGLSGLSIFQSLNGVRFSAGYSDILTDAPLRPDFVGKLPDFTVTATHSALPAGPGLSAPSTGLSLSDATPSAGPSFSLVIGSASFSGNVQVLATRPLSSGVSKPSPRQFTQIAVLSELDPGGINIASFYLSVFPAPIPGMKVAVQMYPVTPNGFRGNAFTQTVTVTAAP